MYPLGAGSVASPAVVCTVTLHSPVGLAGITHAIVTESPFVGAVPSRKQLTLDAPLVKVAAASRVPCRSRPLRVNTTVPWPPDVGLTDVSDGPSTVKAPVGEVTDPDPPPVVTVTLWGP